MVDLRQRIDALTPEKRQLLARRFPLSFSQERLWFLDELHGGSSFYNASMVICFRGVLRRRALHDALNGIVRRHGVLRTSFPKIDGRPIQWVAPMAPVELPTVDLTGLPAAHRERQVERLAEAEAERPFDLARGPLLRPRLAGLGPEVHVLVLSAHHMVLDRWSLDVLLGELAVGYGACLGRAAEPADPPLQFLDFARWQREALSGDASRRQLEFWRRQLDGAPAGLDLPYDRPRPAIESHRGARSSRRLAPDLATALRETSRRLRVTEFMTLLAVFAAWLHRVSGQSDLCVGTPVANRGHADLERLIGFFVNTLVLRCRPGRQVLFEDLLGAVRQRVLEAHEHQDLPFESLVEALRPERDLSRNPLFQVMFIVHARAAEPETFPGLQAELRDLHRQGAMLDLTLCFEPSKEGLTASLIHSTDLFDTSSARRMLSQVESLLRAAVEDPRRGVGELPLLGSAAHHQLLAEWNDAPRSPGAPACLHLLLEARAARTPEAEAVCAGAGSLSYEELQARANRLARHLRDLGVGPEVRVGLFLDRSPELVVAILGVLKAGGAYVPLDPAYPAERLAFLLADSRAAVLVTEPGLSDRLPADHGATVVDLCRERSAIDARPASAPPSGVRPEGLAYVIYTSGSTGRPKGVGIAHRSAAALVVWAIEAFPGESLEAVLASTSVCFDLSIFELFVPLAAGGRVVMAAHALELPALEQSGVTLVNTVPSAAGELVRAGGLPASVRTVCLAGEPLKRELVDRIYECPAVEAVWNLYGPSEDTTYSTFVRVPRRSAREPSIGRPVTGGRAHVLDPWFVAVPVGVAGELYLGGAGVAQGYLGRAGRTAGSFVPDPFGADPGGRLYRTGDLVRRRRNGELDFLGRRDHQVKLRGFRIELGEIESVLLRHPGIDEAAVVVQGLGSEEATGALPGLVACIAARRGAVVPATSEIRSFLGGELPEYMVPATFIALDSLPLTANGKVDRKALQSTALPDPGRDGEPDGFTAPQSPAEEVMASIWSAVLGVERVGAFDHFFRLGGHSLLAVRMLSRVHQHLGAELALRAVFDTPRLADLTAHAERLRASGSTVTWPALVRVRRDRPLVCSFPQRRLWFLDQLEPGRASYNVALALRLGAELDPGVLERCFVEIVRRHEVLRTTFGIGDGDAQEPVQVIAPPGTAGVALPRIDLGRLPAESGRRETVRLARREAVAPFDLTCGPVLRVRLLEGAPEGQALFLTVQHIVADGWSLDVLIREVAALYEAFRASRGSPLPDLPLQYADFAAWQRRWLVGEELERQLDYWKVQLDGAPAVLELPADRPRPVVQSSRGGTVPVALPEALETALTARSREGGWTPFMVLLAAFKVLLARHTAQRDLSVGTPIVQRNHRELESLIGFFTNTLVLRTDLCEAPGRDLRVGELLRRVREVTLAAFSHQQMPFEKLVDELRPERSMSHSPLFQVMFALGETSHEDVRWGDASLTLLDVGTESAKFDLLLSLIRGRRYIGSLHYSTDLFDGSTAARLARHFRSLLAAIVEADDRTPVSALPLLAAWERQQVLAEWNDRETAPADLPTLQQLFDRRLEGWPDRIALVATGDRGASDRSEALSYRELGRRANRLAHLLRDLGVETDTPVGVCLPRAVEMPLAVLGILKAGAACVPLDPSYPAARLEVMLRDARIPVILTNRALAEQIPAGGARRVCLEDDRAKTDPPSCRDPQVPVAMENLAYLIFTSGSTGRPKGIGFSHGALSNLIHWHLESPPSGAGLLASCRTLQYASLSFDASFHEMFATWCSGGCLFVVPEAQRRDAAALGRFLVDTAAEKVILPVVVLQRLAEEALARGLDLSLREIIATGEQLHVTPAVVDFFEHYRDTVLHNHYGPSETHVVTAFALPEDPRDWRSHPSIGLPIARTSIHLLDARMGPVPIAVAGELHVGGVSPARGYLGRPALTAEKFIPDPLGRGPGGRLYKTGDLARFFAGGAIDFLGRIDHQVKVRGFRIEPGEIEAALERCPAVRRSAVFAVGKGDASRLVAYVVPLPGQRLAAAELRSFVGRTLPDPMIPSVFVVLGELPLTPNGKVDRAALARRDLPVPERQEKIVLPRTAIEEIVADIFADCLETERVGIADDFFELGGHSLIATSAILRIRQALSVDVPLRRLFEAPTAAGLASWIEAAVQAGDGLEIPPLERVSSNGGRPAISFAQQRLWLLDQLSPGNSSYNMALRLHLAGDLDRAALSKAFSEIVRRHEILRTVFPPRRGRPSPRVLPAGAVQLASVDLIAMNDVDRTREAWRQAATEMRRPFDLSSRAARFVLLELTESDHWLLVTLHHIVADRESFVILRKELTSLYRAFTGRRRPALEDLPFQYADFAHWQCRWLRGEVLEPHLAYWRRQLRGAPRRLRLPTDHPRPPVQSTWGRRLPLCWSASLSAALRSLSRGSGVTLFMTLVAGFACLLRFLTRQDDVVMGTNVAHREFAETENLIGLFLNQLVLRVDLAGGGTFRELLKDVREVVLKAHRHKDLSFGRLVEELQPRRDPSRSLLYQAKIDVLPETPPDAFKLPGLEVSILELEDPVVRYDLHLTVFDARPELRGFLLYDSDLFDHGSAARFSARLEALLERAASDPEVGLEDLDRYLSEDDTKTAGHQEEELRLELGTVAKQKLRRARRVVVEA